MQRHTSDSANSYITSTTYWPAAAADETRTSVGDNSLVKTRSAWAMSAGRHSGMYL